MIIPQLKFGFKYCGFFFGMIIKYMAAYYGLFFVMILKYMAAYIIYGKKNSGEDIGSSANFNTKCYLLFDQII